METLNLELRGVVHNTSDYVFYISQCWENGNCFDDNNIINN